MKNNHASFKEIEPDARGLLNVRSTSLSILWSLISLITHPHDLTKIEPIITIKKFPNSSSEFIPANT